VPSGTQADLSVKLDFGLSSANLDDQTKSQWPYGFGLLYSVTLDQKSLTTSLIITNEGDKPFECQALLHTYLRVKVRTRETYLPFPPLFPRNQGRTKGEAELC